jgi:hypothetical protein
MDTTEVEIVREQKITRLAGALRVAMQGDEGFQNAIAKSFSSFPDPWEALSELVVDLLDH